MDVFCLAEVMTQYSELMRRKFDSLNPLMYISISSYAMNCFLHVTKARIEYITSQACYRYAMKDHKTTVTTKMQLLNERLPFQTF